MNSVTVLVIEYRRRYRYCISVKILIFADIEPNLGQRLESGSVEEGRHE